MVRSIGCNPELSVLINEFMVRIALSKVIMVMERVPESLLSVPEPSHLS